MSTTRNLRFEDYYPNIADHWMDDPLLSDHVTSILRLRYAKFYKEGEVDYLALKEALLGEDVFAQQKAKELFKSLFRVRVQCLSGHLPYCDIMEEIKKNYGGKILAHGVEEAKGGMYNLLLMCISEKIKGEWGYCVDGPPNISPIPHGPYYLIYKKQMREEGGLLPIVNINDVEHVLLPFPENKAILNELLDQMLQRNLITQQQKTAFSAKLVDYAEFLMLLKRELKEGKKRGINEEIPLIASLSLFSQSSSLIVEKTAGKPAFQTKLSGEKSEFH